MQLFPSISGHPGCSADERDLLSLPCRFGGLGLINPTKVSDSQFDASLLITASLKDLIIKQSVCARPSVETGSGQPGHIFSGSSRSDPVYKLSGSDPDWIT